MAYNFRTKAYNSYDVYKIYGILIINLAAVKLSAVKLISYFN